MIGLLEQVLAELARRREMQPQPRDWREVTPDFVGPPQRGLPPTSYRDPMQAGPAPPTSGGWQVAPDNVANDFRTSAALGGGSMPGPSGGTFRKESPYDRVMEGAGSIADRPDYADYQKSKTTFEYLMGPDGKLYRRQGGPSQAQTNQLAMMLQRGR